MRHMRCAAFVGLLALAVTVAAEDSEGVGGGPNPETPPLAVSERARGKALIACSQVVRKRWTRNVEEVQEEVGALVEANSTLNRTTAGRELAERQLGSCIVKINSTYVGMIDSNAIKDADVTYLIEDPDGVYTEEDANYLDRALSGEMFEGDAPSIMGMQVHKVPFFLQIFYILAVGAGISYCVILGVKKLSPEKEAKVKKEKKAN